MINCMKHDNPQTILHAFYNHVKRTPQNLAAVDEFSSLTYDELNNRSNFLANLLRKKGVKKGDFVGVHIERTKEIFVCAFAIWKIGAIFSPLDETFPSDRLKYIFKDCKTKVLLISKKLQSEKKIFFKANQTIVVDKLKYKNDTTYFDPSVITREDDAVILYTSGTTGNPKGVLHRHQACYDCGYWYNFPNVGLYSHSKVAETANFSTGAAFDLLFIPIIRGSCVYIIPTHMRSNLPALYKYIKDNKITDVALSTSVGSIFAQNFDLRNITLIMAGERANTFKPKYPSRIMNMYGSTEAFVKSIAMVKGTEKCVPVGLPPKEGITIKVFDEHNKEVKPGQTGEMVIKCKDIAFRYLHLEEQTKKKWVTINGEKWFKTGDLAKKDTDGTLYVLGRLENSILKIRDNRIEASEVEIQILKASNKIFHKNQRINNAVCTVRQIDGIDNLVCFYESKSPVQTGLIEEKLRKVLMPFMIPTIWHHMKKLPRSVNGKVLQRLLPNIVSKSDNLYINSLEAIRIAVRIYEGKGIIVNFKDILKFNSRKKLNNFINSLGKKQIKKNKPLKSAPLSLSQEVVYVDGLKNDDNKIYSVSSLIEIKDATISVEQIKNAINQIFLSHDCLKSVLRRQGNEIKFVANKNKPIISILKINSRYLDKISKSLVKEFDFGKATKLYDIKILIDQNKKLYLFTNFSHIIFDGFTQNLFLNDLIDSLEGRTLIPENYTFMHFASEQKKNKSLIKNNTEFFNRMLSHYDSSSYIYRDLYENLNPGPEKKESIQIETANITKFAKENNLKSSSIYLSAILFLVSIFTNNKKVCITTISNGRKNVKLNNTYGMFVNTLPFAYEIKEQKTLDYIRNVQKQLNLIIDHEEISFNEIHQKFHLQPNIFFAYQESLYENKIASNKTISFKEIINRNSIFPIAFEIRNIANGGIELVTSYDSNKYSGTFIKEINNSFHHLLNQLVKTKHFSSIDYLSNESRTKISSFNITKKSKPFKTNIVDWFKIAARKYKNNVALVYKDFKYTYKQLDCLTSELAKKIYLILNKKTNNVGILVKRNQYFPILALSILKAKSMYQPLDHNYPIERIKTMIREGKTKLVIIDDELTHIFQNLGCKSLTVNDLISKGTPNIKLPKINKNDPFINLFTSGSTGKPKGFTLSHYNVVNFVHSHKYLNFGPKSAAAGYSSFGFDAAIMDLYPCLTSGATLHIIPEEIRLDLTELNNYFTKNKITHWTVTTKVGSAFIKEQNNKTLKCLTMAGERMDAVTSQNYRIFNAYGPSECSVCSTYYEVKHDETNPPIGKPTNSVDCFIVDENLKQVPIGASGELLIVGDQVGNGYLNKKMNANKFITYKGMKAFRSGDIVRYRTDGNIEYIGRDDDLIKIRGNRVELKEIENVIYDVPGIKDVTVQVFDSINGSQHINAYVVANDSIDVGKLKGILQSKLPSYMVPSNIVKIPSIPLTVNLKIDKNKLLSFDQSNDKTIDLPRTKTEEIIASSIKEILKIDNISISDNFVDLGGDSIKAISLLSVLNKKHINITISDILNKKTIIEMASKTKFAKDVVIKSQRKTTNKSPLSFPQQGIYLDSLKRFDKKLYCVPFLLTIKNKNYSIQQIVNSLERIFEAHPYLNSNILGDGKTIQLSDNHIHPKINYLKIKSANLKKIKYDLITPFNLAEKLPLYKLTILEDEHQQKYLHCNFHHIIFDGYTQMLFMSDLSSCLDNIGIKNENYSLMNFNVDQCKNKKQLIENEKYIKSTFRNFKLPSKIQGDLVNNQGYGKEETVKSLFDSRSITNFAKKQSVTVSSVYLSALFWLIHAYTKHEDVGLCFISSGRFNPLLVNTYGMFVNTIPLLAHIKTTEKTTKFVKSIHQLLTDGIKHEEYPFSKIASKHHFDMNIVFAYQENISADVKNIKVESLSCQDAKAPLTFEIRKEDNQTFVCINYGSNLYTKKFIKILSKNYIQLLKKITTISTYGKIKINVPVLKNVESIKVIDTQHSDSQTNIQLQNLLIDCFSKILHKKPIKPNDNFIDLGGDSLQAVSLMSLLNKKGVTIDISRVLHRESITSLSQTNKEIVQVGLKEPIDIYGDIKNTPIMSNFVKTKFKDINSFNCSSILEAKRGINYDMLNRAIKTLYNIHPILSAKWDNNHLNVPKTFIPTTVKLINSNNLDRTIDDSYKMINIQKGIPFVVCAINYKRHNYLLLVVNHLICDIVSLNLIIGDLISLYEDFLSNRTPSLKPIGLSFKEYSEKINSKSFTKKFSKENKYWNAINTSLAKTQTSSSKTILKLKHMHFELDRNISRKIIKNSKLKDLLISAISKSYANVFKQNNVSFLFESHGRNIQNTYVSRTAGWFTTVYPLIITNINDQSNIVDYVHNQIESIPNNGIGYMVLNKNRTNTKPLISFNLSTTSQLSSENVNFGIPDIVLNNQIGNNNFGTDINFNFFILNDVVHYYFDYNKNVFSEKKLKQFNSEIFKMIFKLANERETKKDVYVYSMHKDKKKFFMVHSQNTGSEAYYQLAKLIGQHISFIAFEQYNIIHSKILYGIKKIAKEYIKIMKQYQPTGPYIIGGWCYGGSIAYEMAHQLIANGEKVEALIMLDSHFITDDKLKEEIYVEAKKTNKDYFLRDRIFEYMIEKYSIETVFKNSINSARFWLDYVPPKLNVKTLYFKANEYPKPISSTQVKMVKFLKTNPASGFQNVIDKKNLTIVKINASHDRMLDKNKINKIINWIKKFLKI